MTAHDSRSRNRRQPTSGLDIRQRGGGNSPGVLTGQDEWLTVKEICEELKISRRTFDRWRATGTGPHFERLGGHGPLRTRRSWLEAWISGEPHSA